MDRVKKLVFGDDHIVVRNAISCGSWLLSLLLLDITFRVLYDKNNTSPLGFHVGTVFDVMWALILCALGLLLPRLARRIVRITLTAIFGFLLIVHAALDSFFGTYFSLSSTAFAGDGAKFFDWSYITVPKKLLAVILLTLMITVFSVLILPKMKYNYWRIGIACGGFVLGISGVIFFQNLFFPHEEEGGIVWDSKRTVSDIYSEFSDLKCCFHLCGFYHYTFRDTMIFTGLDNFFGRISHIDKLSALDGYYDRKELDPDNEMTGIFKDKNLILIQLESIDSWILNETAMPNLSRLQKQSISFENFYTPKYLLASTFNTEVVVNTGMVPPMNSSRISYFIDTSYPYSLPNLFQKAGYRVNSFHQINGSVYNRGQVHPNWGYEAYNQVRVKNPEEVYLDRSILDDYDRIAPKNERFMSFIITYTGHGPYSADDDTVKRYESILRASLPADVKDEYVWALCHAYETDYFIGLLLDRLEADGRLEDTVLVLYTDHYDHYVTDKEILYSNKGTGDQNLMCQVPFMIYSADTEARTVDKVVASYDILPTLVNLFDLDTDGRYYVGNDAFSENGGYVMFPDRSWYDGKIYYRPADSEADGEIAARNQEITQRLNASWDTIKIDYFKIKE